MTVLANWRYDGKEWDKERNSQSNVDNPNVQTQTVSLFDLVLNPDAVAIPPTPTAKGKGEPEELDITDAGSRKSVMDAVSHKDIAEPQLQNDTSEAPTAEIAPAAAQRTSTVDLDNMEQGSFTNVLRRRTMPQVQVQVQLRPSPSELVD